jgi:7-carboxy-7-deazaguanine synthase
MNDLPVPQANERQAEALPISETFVSLQGEGSRTGAPSTFIRVSGCNLRCRWCDTPYASWSPEGGKRTVASLAQEASRGPLDVVITGGEPMIFDQIEPLCRELRAAGKHITIETAGTVFRELACDLMSISPKLSNSTPRNDPRDPAGAWESRHEERRLNFGALQQLIDRYPDRQLKFVVMTAADLAEIERVLAGLTGWRPEEVFLMPEGTAPKAPGEVSWVVRACLERGWRYAHRLHIDLFGNTRGT